MREDTTIWVGVDLHKRTATACWASPEGQEEDRTFAPEPAIIRRFFKKLAQRGSVRACYEAGPCGYELQRLLTSMGIHCDVIAPSLIPRKPGDRVKTDRRDARKLLRAYRAGDLTPIRVPSEGEEAVRDLVRVREQLRQDRLRERSRLLKFLDRHGRISSGNSNWTGKHWIWIRQQKFEQASTQRTFEEYIAHLEFTMGRLKSLDTAITEIGETAPLKQAVGHLRCLRGVNTLTAVALLAELQDVRRFDSPRQLMSFVGLTPGQHLSAGKGHAQGITKTGNTHVRRLVVEAAWHYIHQPRLCGALLKRSANQPDPIRAIAMKAQHRLYQRYNALTRKGKKPQVAVIAVARELLGFIWAILCKGPDIDVN